LTDIYDEMTMAETKQKDFKLIRSRIS